uniref:Uncharacterized protein n=1 Tax=Knipowitschia caucasica TaxID=637954 RepID=A0AAV2KH11_KNICA
MAPKRKPQVSSLADGEENGYGGAEALCDDPQTPSMADIANLLQGLVRRQTEHDSRWEQEKLQQENRWQSMERRVDQLQQEVKAERPDTPPVVVGAAPAAQAESPNVPAMNVDSCDAQEQRSKTVIGIYANLSNDDTPEDVGVIIEGVTVLQELAVLGLAALGLARTGPQPYWASWHWASLVLGPAVLGLVVLCLATLGLGWEVRVHLEVCTIRITLYFSVCTKV